MLNKQETLLALQEGLKTITNYCLTNMNSVDWTRSFIFKLTCDVTLYPLVIYCPVLHLPLVVHPPWYINWYLCNVNCVMHDLHVSMQ